jgi:hypothetical protein
MNTALDMAHWLRENQQPAGDPLARVLDPVRGECGTYADGFAALAFGLLALRSGDREWLAPCRRALAVARRRPRDSEFDQLALLLLATEAQRAQDDSVGLGGELCRIAASLRLYQGRRLVSNNWIAMRALNHTLRGRLMGNDADGGRAGRLWERVLSWQLPCGLFVDSTGGEATPVTYHAKFCAMLGLGLNMPAAPTPLWSPALPSAGSQAGGSIPSFSDEDRSSDGAMRGALRRGLDALAGLVSPSGALVPYGRSRNTLFGYAAAILALRRGAEIFEEPVYREVACRLEERLRRFRRADGHIPCVLNDGEAARADWDVYVNNPDYNAYAAALLLLAGRGRAEMSNRQDAKIGPEMGVGACQKAEALPEAPGHGTEVVTIGPILTVRDGEIFAAFCTTGQSVPYGTPFFCDHRYYGMQPLWIERGGEALFEPAPYRWRGGEDRAPLVDPSANSWLPYVLVGERRYCVRRYDHVEVRRAGSAIEMEAEGIPEAYDPVPRAERALQSLLARCSGQPIQVFRPRPLPGIRLRRRLTWSAETGALHATTRVSGKLPLTATLHQHTQEFAPRSCAGSHR